MSEPPDHETLLTDDQRLLQAIRVGHIGIFDHDHDTGSIHWSIELRRMYGWDAEEPATLPKIVSHVHPADMERVLATVRRAHDPASDGLFDIEHRIIDRRGVLRWVLTRSQTHFAGPPDARRPRRTIGAVQDVTTRRSDEERLRVLDAVIASSAQAVAIADAKGQLTFVNSALCRLWGYASPEELLGHSLFGLWRVEEEPRVALERILRERTHSAELMATRADGSIFFLGVTAEAVCDAKGELTQVLVNFRDVTDRKRLEDQLLHAQKMESIGRLAGGVAHDFNNMLTVISGGIELSLATLPAEQPSRAYLADAAHAARSAASITRQLLAFSRKGTISPRVLDLNEVIRRAEKMVLRLLGEGISLETRCESELRAISFDPAQVEQIVLNLAVNARDAMPGGGQLAIETCNVELDESAAQEAGMRPGQYVQLRVTDTGVGMTDEVRAHLFEPFFTTKDIGKGTGLGLAMVYGAIQQNGGYVEVESALGRGTTFKIHLPATSARPSVDSRVPVPSGRNLRATILLVEDDAKVRAFAKLVLEQRGHTVHDFGDGKAALEALTSLDPRPQLLLTDVVMPGLNGRVLAERVVGELSGMRVLFVSGHTQSVIAEHGILPRGIEFLAKPYSGAQLGARVQELLAEAPRGEETRAG